MSKLRRPLVTLGSSDTTGKVERFHKTLRAEFLTGKVFASIEEAQAAVDAWVQHYNHERPHQSIGMVAPFERFRLAASQPVEPTATTPPDNAALVTTGQEPATTRRVGANGLINHVGAMLGFENLPGWVSNPDTALGTIILLNVWTFGSPMIIFLAGLRQIPEMYYEAASVDGASKVAQFFKITIPLLTPIIFFNVVLQVINAFQSFTQAFVVSGGTGGPSDSTMFYTLYLYIKGFTQFDMGYASAMAWLLLIIVAIFTAINFFVSKFWVFYDD